MEEWKISNEYPIYSGSNLGRIKNNQTTQILNPYQRQTVRYYCYGKITKRTNINLKFLSNSDDIINKKIDPETIPKNEHKKLNRGFNINKAISIYNKNDNTLIETITDHIEISKKYEITFGSIIKHCNGEIKYSKLPYIFEFA
jgi:hypothetical protein